MSLAAENAVLRKTLEAVVAFVRTGGPLYDEDRLELLSIIADGARKASEAEQQEGER